MNNNNQVNEISLKFFFTVLNRRKITFIITFLLILLMGLVYTFLVAPEYGSSSQIKISDDDIYFNDDLYKYFPGEASNLWIFQNYNRINTAIGKLNPIVSELKSGITLNEIIKKANLKISPSVLLRSININIDKYSGIVTITTYSKTKESAYQVNKILLETYINSKKTMLEVAYSDLFSKIDLRLKEVNTDLEGLSVQARQSALEFSIKWYDELEKFGLGKIDISFIDPILEQNIETKYEEFNVLKNTKQNLVNDKDFFINRIEIIQNPEMSGIQDNSNYLRNILLSLVAAIIIGIIVSFLFNYFKSSRNL